MKAPAPALLFSVPVSIFAAWAVSVATWEELRPALLPALAIVAAAVLVRLARGLPFTNADHFTLVEFRETASRLTEIALKLRTMMWVCLAAIVQLICYPSLLSFLESVPSLLPVGLSFIERGMSALLALTTTYAFVRIIEIIQIDVALLKLQARVLEKAIASKNFKAFEKQIEAHPPGRIAGETTFGRPLQ